MAALSAALFATTYLAFVRTGWGQRLDDAALAGRGRQPPDVMDGVLDLLSTIDLGSLLVAVLAIVMLGYRRGHARLAVGAGGVIVGAIATAEVLKRVVLTRPDLLGSPDPFGSGNSLPSGHATVAMAVAMALLLAVSPPLRWRVAIIGGAYAIAIGGATISAGWHRPSDVAAAYLLVTVWASVTATRTFANPAPLERDPRSRKPAAGASEPTARATLLLAAALAALFGVLVIGGWGDLVRLRFTAAYAIGLGVPALVGGALLVTFCQLLGNYDGNAFEPPAPPYPDSSP